MFADCVNDSHFFHWRLPCLKYSWQKQHNSSPDKVVSIKGHVCRTWHECKNIIQQGLWTLLNWSISIICCWIPKSAHHPQRKQLAFAGYWVHEAFILIYCLTVDWNIKKWMKKNFLKKGGKMIIDKLILQELIYFKLLIHP